MSEQKEVTVDQWLKWCLLLLVAASFLLVLLAHEFTVLALVLGVFLLLGAALAAPRRILLALGVLVGLLVLRGAWLHVGDEQERRVTRERWEANDRKAKEIREESNRLLKQIEEAQEKEYRRRVIHEPSPAR
jgi:thiol:disulfide interchange protein